MELNQIKQFRVIARTESISKAAELLFIAQPSLSQTLKRLENELGTPLFDRRGRRIVLNGAGKIFLKYCDEIVFALDNATKEISEYIGNEKSDINIWVESTSLIIPDVVDKMRKYYPWSLPHMYQGFCDDWDIKICSDICPDCGNLSTVVIEEPIGVMFPKNHFLALKDEIRKKDLEECDFLCPNQTDGLVGIIFDFCSKADFKPNITMYVESPWIIHELLKSGVGVSFAPQYTWHCYYNEQLEFRQVSDMPMRQFVHLIMNDKKYVTKNMQCCYDALVKFYREYAQKFC
ncbi:MAG: LysR family transcriptional regulator [Oscillospiraceae bacterium]|nr:LysR family transcriptional regulator [Oscillospiraceae bacterium]